MELLIFVFALAVCALMVVCSNNIVAAIDDFRDVNRKIYGVLDEMEKDLDLIDDRLIDLAADSDYWRGKDERDDD